MIKLTNEEKAARHDSLQVAIKYTMESYRRLRDDSDKRFSEARDCWLDWLKQEARDDQYQDG